MATIGADLCMSVELVDHVGEDKAFSIASEQAMNAVNEKLKDRKGCVVTEIGRIKQHPCYIDRKGNTIIDDRIWQFVFKYSVDEPSATASI